MLVIKVKYTGIIPTLVRAFGEKVPMQKSDEVTMLPGEFDALRKAYGRKFEKVGEELQDDPKPKVKSFAFQVEGPTIKEIKAELEALAVEIPKECTKRADLLALLESVKAANVEKAAKEAADALPPLDPAVAEALRIAEGEQKA